MTDWKPLLERLDGLLERLDRIAPDPTRAPDWKAAQAFRWRKNARGGYLEAVLHPHTIRFADSNPLLIRRICDYPNCYPLNTSAT